MPVMHCLCEKRCPRGCVLGMPAPGEPVRVRVGQVAMGAERAARALLRCLPVALREAEWVGEVSSWEACAWGSGPRARSHRCACCVAVGSGTPPRASA